MREIEKFFLEVQRALEDIQYKETRSYRRRSRVNPYSTRGYYEELGPPYLLILIENSGRKELIYDFVKRAIKLAPLVECYWSLLFGTEKGVSFHLMPRAGKLIEELEKVGEKDWRKALSWLKYHVDRMGEPKAVVSLLFTPPPEDLIGAWRRVWEEVNFLAIFAPATLGNFLKLSDYFISFRVFVNLPALCSNRRYFLLTLLTSLLAALFSFERKIYLRSPLLALLGVVGSGRSHQLLSLSKVL